MKINKKLYSLVLLVNLIFVFSFGGILGCRKTKEPRQSQITENHENEVNRLIQNLPLSKEVIQDESIHYKCDLQRTGVFKGENPKLKGEVLWELEMKEEFPGKFFLIGRHSSPIIFEDILYIGNIDYNMYAIDTNTGKLKWSFKTDGPITSAAALWNRTLYFGSEDSSFYAVNIDTHKLRWKYRTDGPIYSSPAIAEKMVFFGSTDGTFYALDALTGEEKWKFNTKQSISCNPAILNDRIYFVSNPEQSSTNSNSNSNSNKQDNNLPMIIALDLLTGEEIWQIETNEGYLDNLCIVEGESTIDNLYVGFSTQITPPDIYEVAISCAGVINIDISFDTHKTSRLRGFYPSHAPFLSDPSCNDTTLCFSSDNVYAINIGNTRMIGKRYQDYITCNEYMWEYKVKAHSRGETGRDQVNTSPAFNSDGSIVYFGDDNGYLHAVEIDTGKEILEYTPSKSLYGDYINFFPDFRSIMSFPVLYKGKIYIYACENYEEVGSINSKQIGVLYCIQ